MKPVWTLEDIVAQLTNWQGRWDTQNPVPFSFYELAPAHLAFESTFSAFSIDQRVAFARIADLVSDVANIDFAQVGDNSLRPDETNSRLSFYNIDTELARYWGAATNFVTENNGLPMGRIYGAEFVVNLNRASVQGGWDLGESNPRKLMHELLHTIGLDHPGDYNGDGPTYDSDALFYQDSLQYTVMSYWAAAQTGADHEAGGTFYYASTPLLYDVAALQALYGANMTTRTGDTVYGFNSTAGRSAFDLALNPHGIFTIWDAGGNDTLDLSGYAAASVIDLNQGGFTDANGLTDNISIAYGVTIENAVGGSGDDILIGNEADNMLDGGAGADVAIFGDSFDEAAISFDGDALLVTTLTGGTDRLIDIETLSFQDRDVLVADLIAQPGYILIANSGLEASIGASGRIIGTTGVQDITVLSGTRVEFDSSFNSGGDRIRLSGIAADYSARMVGSRIEITDGETLLSIPVGPEITDLVFEDGVRSLAINVSTNAVTIGLQVITATSAQITAAATQAHNLDPTSPDVSGRLILIEGASVSADGNLDINGTAAEEVIQLVNGGGLLRFDSSFNGGGDTVILEQAAADYQAHLSGSRVVLTFEDNVLSIPVGTAGLTLGFTDGDRVLRYDPGSGNVLIGNDVVDSTPSPLSAGGPAEASPYSPVGAAPEFSQDGYQDAVAANSINSVEFGLTHLHMIA